MPECECSHFSGIKTDIKNLNSRADRQRGDLISMRNKIDSIMSKLNLILGGIVVSIVVLLIDIACRASALQNGPNVP